MTSNSLRTAQVLWPAFLMAGVLEMVVFSVVDPTTLSLGAWSPEPITVYSLAFFVFWALMALAAALTQWMTRFGQSDESSGSVSTRGRRHRGRHGVTQHV